MCVGSFIVSEDHVATLLSHGLTVKPRDRTYLSVLCLGLPPTHSEVTVRLGISVM